LIVFIAIVGISALGLGAVAWLLIKEKNSDTPHAQRITPEEIKKADFARLKEKTPPKEKTSLFSKLKLPKKEPREKKEAPARSPSAKFNLGNILSKIKLKKKTAVEGLEPDEESPSKGKSLINNLLGKLKLGKKKKLEDEDIPQATSFPSLKEKLNQISRTKAQEPAEKDTIPLLKDKQMGTASLHTSASAHQKEASPALSKDEESDIEKEVESATQLTELKQKYEKLDQILGEKSSELDKTKHSYDSEISHRKDFNKIKDLLEKELKEVKDRVKAVRSELTNTKVENENAQKRIKQLEEKATKLEKEILAKEEENEELRKKAGQPVKSEQKNALTQQAPSKPMPAVKPQEEKTLPPPQEPQTIKQKMAQEDITKFEESLGFSETAETSEKEKQPASVEPQAKPEPILEPTPEPTPIPTPEPTPEPKLLQEPPPPQLLPEKPSEEIEERPDEAPERSGFLKLRPDPTTPVNQAPEKQEPAKDNPPEEKKE